MTRMPIPGAETRFWAGVRCAVCWAVSGACSGLLRMALPDSWRLGPLTTMYRPEIVTVAEMNRRYGWRFRWQGGRLTR